MVRNVSPTGSPGLCGFTLKLWQISRLRVAERTKFLGYMLVQVSISSCTTEDYIIKRKTKAKLCLICQTRRVKISLGLLTRPREKPPPFIYCNFTKHDRLTGC